MRKLNINPSQYEIENYIEGNDRHKEKIKKFPISKTICEEIYKNLLVEIKEINKMLPDDEQIKPTCKDYEDAEFEPLFTNNDIDFLKKTIGTPAWTILAISSSISSIVKKIILRLKPFFFKLKFYFK